LSTYAIGDIQGCYEELLDLLDHIQFNKKKDRLWFAGDLVNRGPNSLEVLRFVKKLGDRAVVVLGNHDLHLLALDACGGRAGAKSSLNAVLDAPDREELMRCLRHQLLMHCHDDLQYCILHAGLPPQWSVGEALGHADELHAVLQDDARSKLFFAEMYGNQPRKWDSELRGFDRLRFITNCFTRLRYCSKKGKLDLKEKGAPGTQDKNRYPWFMIPQRKSANQHIIFGHWSTLGLMHGVNATCLDTGCLWGGSLTALRLEDGQLFSLNCLGRRVPGSKR